MHPKDGEMGNSPNVELCTSNPAYSLNFWLFPDTLEKILAEGQSGREMSYWFAQCEEEKGWIVLLEPQESRMAKEGEYSFWDELKNRTTFTDYKVLPTLHCLIEENGNGSIKLTCPYITYTQFQRSRGFLCDYKYTDYLKLLTLLQYQSNIPQTFSGAEFTQKFCREKPTLQIKNELPRWGPNPFKERHSSLDSDNMFKISDGFFNNIPGDSALVDIHNVAGGFDLVSSSWVDWKEFVLHEESANHKSPANIDLTQSRNQKSPLQP